MDSKVVYKLYNLSFQLNPNNYKEQYKKLMFLLENYKY